MKLDNTFSIPVPAANAWPILLDLERIAPCVPGATITGRDGDDFHGKIKVKLGPVGLAYTGIIKVVDQDEDAKIAVLEGGGRETRGNGTAKATITCRLVESEGTTEVSVDTDLDVTGKPAQFGRGALADVASTLIGRFADNLAEEISASAQPAEAANHLGAIANETSTVATSGNSAETKPEAAAKLSEPIDLLNAAGVDSKRRVALVAAGLTLITCLFVARRRARRRCSR